MRIFTFFTSLLMAILLTACGGGGGSPGITSGSPVPALVTTAPATLTIGVGASQDFVVSGGKGPYRISSVNSQAVLASLRNETQITIGGVSTGASNVTLTDADNRTTVIAVTVANLVALTTTAPTTGFALTVNNQRTFTINGGVPGYSVVSSDPRFVSASLSGSTVTITSLAIGPAVVTIRDTAGTQVTVPVVVNSIATLPLATNAPAVLQIVIGTQRVFKIIGGAPSYTADSTDRRFVLPSISGDTLIINAIAITPTSPAVTVTVSDAENKTSTPITVIVVPGSTLDFFTTVPASVTLPPSTTTEFSVGGGVAPYGIVSSNPQFVSATIIGSVLKIQTFAEGSATLTIRDASGKTLTPSTVVTVLAPTPVVTPNNATGLTADTLFATITNGTPPYRVEVGNSLVASAKVTNQNRLEVTLGQAGSTIATVLDANNKSAPFAVTVTTATPTFRLSPNPVTVSENDSAPIVFTVFGGSLGIVNAFSSDITLLQVSASVDGKTITAVTGTRGDRCVLADTPVTITVVDSARAIGTSIVTIQNNLAGCNVSGPNSQLVLSQTAITIPANSSDVFASVTGGSGKYLATSSNTLVATATVDANGVITIKRGTAAGTAIITLQDGVNTSNRRDITVTVNPGAVAPPSALFISQTVVTIPAASSSVFASVTGGSGNYLASSSNISVATAVVSPNGVITITRGTAAGTATITLQDAANTANSGTIAVTVNAATIPLPSPLVLSQMNVIIPDTSLTPVFVSVSGGSGNYLPNTTSSDSSVATATVSATGVVTITRTLGPPIPPSTLPSPIRSSGTTIITIQDTVNSALSATITVIIDSGITFDPGSLNFALSSIFGNTLTTTINGGSGVFSIPTSSNTAIATATVVNRVLTVTRGALPGTAFITVRDSLNGSFGGTLTVTVPAP